MTSLMLVAGADAENDERQLLVERLIAPGRANVIRLLLAACHVTLPRDVTSLTRDDDVDELLRDHVTRPTSLQRQCRWTIRRVTSRAVRGRHFLSALSRLPLPKPLRDYIALRDELRDNDQLSWTRVIQQLGFC